MPNHGKQTVTVYCNKDIYAIAVPWHGEVGPINPQFAKIYVGLQGFKKDTISTIFNYLFTIVRISHITTIIFNLLGGL